MNLSNFEQNLGLGTLLLEKHKCLEEEFGDLPDVGRMGVLGALIANGYDTRDSIAFAALRLFPPEHLSNVMWGLEKGTGISRQRRLWDRRSDGRYVLQI